MSMGSGSLSADDWICVFVLLVVCTGCFQQFCDTGSCIQVEVFVGVLTN